MTFRGARSSFGHEPCDRAGPDPHPRVRRRSRGTRAEPEVPTRCEIACWSTSTTATSTPTSYASTARAHSATRWSWASPARDAVRSTHVRTMAWPRSCATGISCSASSSGRVRRATAEPRRLRARVLVCARAMSRRPAWRVSLHVLRAAGHHARGLRVARARAYRARSPVRGTGGHRVRERARRRAAPAHVADVTAISPSTPCG